MKYFIDTEFLEGTQTKRVLGFNIGQTKPTIDLISIGIVSEDGREYYAISKEFNLKEAWNRFQWKVEDIHPVKFRQKGMSATYGDMAYPKKEYWILDNVLRPIWNMLCVKEGYDIFSNPHELTYNNFRKILNKYGKTNAQIAEEVKMFCSKHLLSNDPLQIEADATQKEFYGYYADYDWVAFCWLFGKMIDLPQGFPKYCNDLKQMMNEKVSRLETYQISKIVFPDGVFGFTNDADGNLSVQLDRIKTSPNYPKQTNNHDALADARWNKKLYEFLKTF